MTLYIIVCCQIQFDANLCPIKLKMDGLKMETWGVVPALGLMPQLILILSN